MSFKQELTAAARRRARLASAIGIETADAFLARVEDFDFVSVLGDSVDVEVSGVKLRLERDYRMAMDLSSPSATINLYPF